MKARDIEARVSPVREYLSYVNRYVGKTAKDLQQDIDIRGAVERYLFLTAQATIDLAEGFIAGKKYRPPSSLHEAFDILRENQVIDENLCNRFHHMMGLRNVLTYDHQGLDYEVVEQTLNTCHSDVDEFLLAIQQAV